MMAPRVQVRLRFSTTTSCILTKLYAHVTCNTNDYIALHRHDGSRRCLGLKTDIDARAAQLAARAVEGVQGHVCAASVEGHEPPGRRRRKTEGGQVAPQAMKPYMYFWFPSSMMC